MPDLDANVRIRAARLSDAPRLAALMRELGYETTSNEMRARLKSIVRDSRYSTLVAKIGREVCGMIGTLTHKSHEHNDLSGKIVALVVSMKQRRSGIGRALIAAAEKDFARRNVARVTLTTRFERRGSASILRGGRLHANRSPFREEPHACGKNARQNHQ